MFSISRQVTCKGGRNWRFCKICNQRFHKSPRSKRVTCSKKCRYQLLSWRFSTLDKTPRPCPICGKKYVPLYYQNRPSGRRIQKTCSVACGSKLRWRSGNGPSRSRNYPEKNCEYCGETYKDKKYKQGRQFCSRSCAAKAKMQNQAHYRTFTTSRPSPDARLASSVRMKTNNPMFDPEIVAKMVHSNRVRGHYNGFQNRGGNGQLTTQQEKLAQALGWPTEYSIPTGNPKWPAAVTDLAAPQLRIAVEVDGRSHRSQKQKNRDRMKMEMLASLGWIVLRFWNGEIDNQLESVLNRIENWVQLRSSLLSQ